MWKFKSCPKCYGDLYVDWDLKAKKEHTEKEAKLAHAGPKDSAAK